MNTDNCELFIDDLLSRMTIEEKAGQANQGGIGPYKEFIVSNTGMGHLACQQGGGITSRQAAENANEMQKTVAEGTRLGIPLLIGADGILDARVADATTFPQQIAMGATWNPDLIKDAYAVIGREMKVCGYGRTYTPNLGLSRDPRFGRTGECFSEDTFLTSRMAEASVTGLQEEGVMATMKHYAGYDGTIGGKDSSAMDISERMLREVYLPPFKAAVDAGAGSVMCAYNAINGIPAAANPHLLREILKEEWEFDGFVVTDYVCIESLINNQHVVSDIDEAAELAFKSGIDVHDHEWGEDFAQKLANLVRDGRIPESVLDDAARRTLRAKFKLGLFDNPYVDPSKTSEIVNSAEHRAIARKTALESIVLLKNDDKILPLQKDLRSIAVIGPNADSIKNQLGVWVKEVAPGFESGIITILQGIRSAVSSATEVRYAKGCGVMPGGEDDLDPENGIREAVEIAAKSDVAIMVIGDSPELNNEGHDRAHLDLTGRQEELVKAVHATGTPMVVVLINGRPLTINSIAEQIPAIIEAWNPGEEGGNAVADVLFGDYNPGGKLPITFPRSMGQLPVYYDYEPGWHATTYVCGTPATPLYPFGYGLSYTTFEYTNLRLSSETIQIGDSVDVSIDVCNTGDRVGDEVVQLYIHDVVASRVRPVKQLRGFRRINLHPDECHTVTFTLKSDDLMFYDREMRYVVEPGVFEIMVGSNSNDLQTINLNVVSG